MFPKVSIFKSCKGSESKIWELEKSFDLIRGGSLQELTTAVKQASPNDKKEHKLLLPYMIPSVETSSTKIDDTEELKHTGILVADIDGKDNPSLTPSEMVNKIKSLESVLGYFVSPSQTGIKVFFKIPTCTKKHKGSFLAVKEILKGIGLNLDKFCSDLKRGCWISHDSDAWLTTTDWADIPEITPKKINENCTTKVKTTTQNITKDQRDIKTLLKVIPADCTRKDWLQIAGCIKGAIKGEGFELFHEWSKEGTEKYKGEDDCIECWNKAWDMSSIGAMVNIAKSYNDGKNPLQGDIDALFGVEPFAYYDQSKRVYLVLDAEGEDRIPLSKDSYRSHLKVKGYSNKLLEGMTFSEIDQIITRTETCNAISYCGSIAGKFKGVYKINGIKYLITQEPDMIEAVEGDWSNLEKIFRGILCDSEDDITAYKQLQTFYSWLQLSVKNLKEGSTVPAQALAFAGEAGCGKSTLQNHIITPILGGRSAPAGEHFTTKQSFNSSLFKCEHLRVDDEFCSQSSKDRYLVASLLKQFTVAQNNQSMKQKFADEVSVTPFWRLTISLNDDPDDLAVLPPIKDGVADKITLFRCTKNNYEFPDYIEGDFQPLEQVMKKELPHFIYFLENEYEIPASIKDPRYGVKAFQHTELLKELNDLCVEEILMELIQKHLVPVSGNGEWQGTPSDLKEELTSNDKCSVTAKELLKTPSVTGTYLKKLAKKYPDQIQLHRTSSKRIYKIQSKGMTDIIDLVS